MPIEHISDTAKWVAYYRAMETDRPDAIFSDPFARRLAGLRGEEIVDQVKRGRSMAWAMIVRACWIVTVVFRGGSASSSSSSPQLAAGATPFIQPSSIASRCSRRKRFAGLNVAPRPLIGVLGPLICG